MENQKEKNGLLTWLKQSATVKLAMVGFLSLLLLIPSSWVIDLISERQGRQREVIKEIAQSWSGIQNVVGPVLVIPYTAFQQIKDDKGNITVEGIKQYIFLMPDRLDVNADAVPQLMHRGIFDAVVYNAKVAVKGNFEELDLKKLGVEPQYVLWDKAQLLVSVSDVKGLKEIPKINLGDTIVAMEPSFSDLSAFKSSLSSTLDLGQKKHTQLSFSFELPLRGSEGLFLTPIGKHTHFTLAGKWKDPSFTGSYLPETRSVSDASFTSQWNIPHFNRPFPQQWVDKDGGRLLEAESGHSCGVNFLLPVDQYQKTMRSAKYAMLIILLTFVSLLFTEFITKKFVNIVQYVLIGLAMVVYYTLLLSFSEQIGFTWAYIIASLATIGLVGAYISSILKSSRSSLLLASILSAFYLFIYVIIQLQEMALLVGSVGLFIVIASLMYVSSKISWENE
ncbi:cell envelope integrity protein CreD [Olivibacter sp. XZL3]|uniref:cell envelope integrity protein CreD n=1 Tax=Olivibacter sp. XZL3 TaxID=1735116 RepID=UPI001067130C|nr:cell envelope integrity protein CreD [Olivibacter sp. XZL3]